VSKNGKHVHVFKIIKGLIATNSEMLVTRVESGNKIKKTPLTLVKNRFSDKIHIIGLKKVNHSFDVGARLTLKI
jgi:hypothetical protein